MGYGSHLDAAFMGTQSIRADLSLTLFLAAPDEYDGGELIIETEYGELAEKSAAGDCVLYSTTARHRVAPVTRGRREVCVLWIQSLIREPDRRRILFELAGVLEYLDRRDIQEPWVEIVRRCQLDLLRLWGSP
jgi:PKHD-type hydroxylase